MPLLVLPFLAWFLPQSPKDRPEPDKVNLALRRTADGLLRLAGDSTSNIPPVQQSGANSWQVKMEQTFSYDNLPALLQSSLELYGIQQPYEVAVRSCAEDVIELGYHQQDYLQEKNVPCQERAMSAGCHYIDVTFAVTDTGKTLRALQTGVAVLLGGLAGFWFFRRQKPAPPAPADNPDHLLFGQSRLDVAGQLLWCNGVRQNLTYRETKLLRLFAAHPGQLLERDTILQEVWADEGVLVGRSIDMFVSRLRKKLASDPSVAIVAVHGVGYRLEVTKA